MKTTYDRYILFTFVFIVTMAWCVFLVFIVTKEGATVIEGAGVGIVLGLLFAMVKDAWQFLWRKSGPGESKKPPDSHSTTATTS